MFLAPVIEVVHVKSWDVHQFERRKHRRYRISLPLVYKVLNRGRAMSEGCGRTLNISSHGVFFSAQEFLPQGHSVELFIDWPVLQKDLFASQLVLTGQIVRNVGKDVGVKFVQYQFRTTRGMLGVPMKLAAPV